jgi:hypothetical protein
LLFKAKWLKLAFSRWKELDKTQNTTTGGGNMAGPVSLSQEEAGRVARLTADFLDLIKAKAALEDGKLDEAAGAQLAATWRTTLDRVDVQLALDIVDRLEEGAIRAYVENAAPPSVRAALDARIEAEGGLVPLLKTRIAGLGPGGDKSGPVATVSDGVGCALGAVAIAGGFFGNGVLGGIAVVAGIVAMSEWC